MVLGDPKGLELLTDIHDFTHEFSLVLPSIKTCHTDYQLNIVVYQMQLKL